jgi:copper chaperone CopZ
MRTEYAVEGMHCQSCVAKVSNALRSVPGVKAADVALADRRATIDTEATPNEAQLRDAVHAAGDYELKPIAPTSAPAAAHANHPTDPIDSTPQESLYPLFLIVGYILGAVLLIAWAANGWRAEPIMRHFMAGFFLVFSFFKLLDLRGFVSAYRMYDIPARAFAPWAWAYPFVELALGVAYLVNAFPVATNIVTLVVMTVGAIGVLRAILDKRRIRCACLGTALNLPMTKVTLVEDLTMAAMAAGMLALHFA